MFCYYVFTNRVIKVITIDFFALQKEVSELMDRSEPSLTLYFSLAQKLDAVKETPDYIRRVRVAFLSNFTLQGLPEVFKAQAVFHNLLASTYLGPYNQYALEILDKESKLNKEFKPNLIYLLVDPEDPEFERIDGPIENIIATTSAYVVIFKPKPGSKIYDRYEIWYKNHERILSFDLDQFLKEIGGKEKYWNTKYKALGDFRLAPDAFHKFANALMSHAVATAGAAKKCLVTDLDHTLWQGIVGEDGIDREPNKNLHQYLLKLSKDGIILAINSRNNKDDVLEVFERYKENKELLNESHFKSQRINWEDKVKNMRELAVELNLGLDSFVFIDDDPFQRNMVRDALPSVAVMAPECIYEYPGFKSLFTTVEDILRGKMYNEERQRQDFKTSLKSVEDFLKELQIKPTIWGIKKEIKPSLIPRISQLTQKTNQFNLATRRYSQQEIINCQKKGWKIFAVSAADRFGDYGTIGVAMIEPQEKAWRIDNFLMSCRILGRDIEKMLIIEILNIAKNKGVDIVIGEFIPAAKINPPDLFI